MKKSAAVLFLLSVFTLALVVPAMAETVNWKGVDWDSPYGSIVVNLSGNLEVNITSDYDTGVYAGAAHYNTSSAFRAYATPWVQMTWIDELASSGKGRLWIEKEGVPNPAWTSPGASDTQYRVYEWNPATDWEKLTLLSDRSNGSHTLKVGKRSDGKVDYILDGALAYTSDTADIVWPYFGDVYLAGIDSSPGAKVIFTDYQFGDGYAPVPLPGTLLLLGSGLTGLVLWRQWKAAVKG